MILVKRWKESTASAKAARQVNMLSKVLIADAVAAGELVRMYGLNYPLLLLPIEFAIPQEQYTPFCM